jgi:hypothetical protein
VKAEKEMPTADGDASDQDHRDQTWRKLQRTQEYIQEEKKSEEGSMKEESNPGIKPLRSTYAILEKNRKEKDSERLIDNLRN